ACSHRWGCGSRSGIEGNCSLPTTVPGTVVGSEQLPSIPVRELRAGIELDAKAGIVRGQLQYCRLEIRGWSGGREFTVHQFLAVAIRKAEMLARRGHHVQFLRRHIVAPQVATIVAEPELAG